MGRVARVRHVRERESIKSNTARGSACLLYHKTRIESQKSSKPSSFHEIFVPKMRFRQFRLSLVEENQLNSVLGSDDRRVAHVMDRRARARPFAASKLAAVVVAIVAFGTADAATLSGSAGAGHQYTTSTDTTTQEALSTAISGFDWSTFAASDYTADIASHINTWSVIYNTWNSFLTHYGSGNAVVKDYIDGALVSPDFKDREPYGPQKTHLTRQRDQTLNTPLIDSTNQLSSQAGTSITLEATTAQVNAAKAEMIEKTVQDMVTTLAVIVNAEAGEWDKAAAYFYGASGKSAYTIYGRAEKRCANYGTCDGQGGEATVNAAIGAALTDKYDAGVIQYIKVLYAQNVLRSANKIDQNMDDPIEIIAEGQAFWRFLAPWMTDHSNDAVKVFDRMFSTTYHPQAANNYNYCIAKKHIDSFLTSVMGSANAAANALGSLNEVPSGVTCPTDGNGLITTRRRYRRQHRHRCRHLHPQVRHI